MLFARTNQAKTSKSDVVLKKQKMLFLAPKMFLANQGVVAIKLFTLSKNTK